MKMIKIKKENLFSIEKHFKTKIKSNKTKLIEILNNNQLIL